jgi:hypothetical protein
MDFRIFSEKRFFIILILAIALKLCLFIFGTMKVPESRMLFDSSSYMETAKNLAEKGRFAIENQDHVLVSESFRTPGYPLFLAFFHHLLKIPMLGVLFFQLMLTVIVAVITYVIAQRIDPRIALLSATIVLFDPPISIFSVMVLTEGLFLLMLTLFLFLILRYIKDKKFYWLGLSAILLVLATYVRPIAYFLAIPVAGFIVYAHRLDGLRRGIAHVLIFLVLVYGLLGAWQIRNHYCCGTNSFATVASKNFSARGLFQSVEKKDNLFSQGIAFVDAGWTCFLSMMTQPGSLKYFGNKLVTRIGKFIFYPWMIFWFSGFWVGCACLKKDRRYQFLLLVILYFLGVTILNIAFLASERFRMPIMPAIAILSALGWSKIIPWLKERWSERDSKCC